MTTSDERIILYALLRRFGGMVELTPDELIQARKNADQVKVELNSVPVAHVGFNEVRMLRVALVEPHTRGPRLAEHADPSFAQQLADGELDRRTDREAQVSDEKRQRLRERAARANDASRAEREARWAQEAQRAREKYRTKGRKAMKAQYLATLGLPNDAVLTPLAIKRAFRLRTLEAHPDRGGSDEEMIELLAARDQALAALG